MKGQTSLELLVTLGIVIAFTIPVLFLLLSATSIGYEDTAKAQADASARTLSDTINLVYAQGEGAKRTILLNTPSSTQAVYAADGEAVVVLKTQAGIFEAVSPTIADIGPGSETIEKTGLFVVIVENVNGKVELDDPYN